MNATDENGFTPLHHSAELNPVPEVLTILLHAGGDVNANAGNAFTPLHSAAKKNRNQEIVMRLLNTGANANAVDVDGKLPLEYAEENEALKGTDALQALRSAVM